MNNEAIKYTRQRQQMVKHQIEARGIKDPAVLQALLAVPRHLFVSEALRDQAYGDYPLRMATFVAEDYDTIEDMLTSARWQELENRMQSFVQNYSHRIVAYRRGFQFIR